MLKEDLCCSLIQQPLIWQAPDENRHRFAGLISSECRGSDLVVLPEMFTAGFSMDVSKFAEPENGATLQWMADMASSSEAAIVGSYAVIVNDKTINRLVWMRPDGSYETYAKRHLFRMAGEHKRYQAGSEKLLVELKGWRVCPMICYDLRFPVWCRNQDDYDLLIFVANWPQARADHWTALLKARAIENLACVIGVNRIGIDGKGHPYSGDSIALDAKGGAIVNPGSAEGVFKALFSAQELNRYREAFPAHLDADAFQIL